MKRPSRIHNAIVRGIRSSVCARILAQAGIDYAPRLRGPHGVDSTFEGGLSRLSLAALLRRRCSPRLVPSRAWPRVAGSSPRPGTTTPSCWRLVGASGQRLRMPALRFPHADGPELDEFNDPGNPLFPIVGVAAEKLRAKTTPQQWAREVAHTLLTTYGCGRPQAQASRSFAGEAARVFAYPSCPQYLIVIATVHDRRGYVVFWGARKRKADQNAGRRCIRPLPEDLPLHQVTRSVVESSTPIGPPQIPSRLAGSSTVYVNPVRLWKSSARPTTASRLRQAVSVGCTVLAPVD